MRDGPFQWARMLCDVASSLLGFAVAFGVYIVLVQQGVLAGRSLPSLEAYAQLAVVHAGVLVVTSWWAGLYLPRAGILNLWEIRASVRASLLTAAFLLAGIFIFKLQTFSRFVVVGALMSSAVLVLLGKRVLAGYRQTRRGQVRDRVLVVGLGPTGRLLMKKILTAPRLGYSMLGFLDPDAPIGEEVSCITDQATLSIATRKVLGRPEDLESLTANTQIDTILVDESRLTQTQMTRLQLDALGLGIAIDIAPALRGLRTDQFRLEDLGAVPLLRIRPVGARLTYEFVKRALDIVGASVFLILTAPIFLVCWVLIPLESRGPALFSHDRVGLGGKLFKLRKFRTMQSSADPYSDSPVGDRAANITRVGRILRATGLDELPQLLNILNGEMSLVGPRPEMPQIVARYTDTERRRLRVKPGLTGLWQISPDRHAHIHENLEYDTYYINNRSFLLDIIILLETLFVTVEIVVKRVLRSEYQIDRGPAQADHLAEAAARQRYVLLAMDQRRSGAFAGTWRKGIDLALHRPMGLPVRVTTSASNLDELEGLIRESTEEGPGQVVRIVEVSNPSEVRSLISGARTVITNLKSVEGWAREQGAQLVAL